MSAKTHLSRFGLCRSGFGRSGSTSGENPNGIGDGREAFWSATVLGRRKFRRTASEGIAGAIVGSTVSAPEDGCTPLYTNVGLPASEGASSARCFVENPHAPQFDGDKSPAESGDESPNSKVTVHAPKPFNL